MVNNKKKRVSICIICPKCCELEVEDSLVEGAKCERGEEFAIQEAVLPLRTITTTLRCETPEGTRIIPVKTAFPVPLAHTLDIMKHIKRLRLNEIPKIGSRVKLSTTSEPIELIVTGD